MIQEKEEEHKLNSAKEPVLLIADKQTGIVALQVSLKEMKDKVRQADEEWKKILVEKKDSTRKIREAKEREEDLARQFAAEEQCSGLEAKLGNAKKLIHDLQLETEVIAKKESEAEKLHFESTRRLFALETELQDLKPVQLDLKESSSQLDSKNLSDQVPPTKIPPMLKVRKDLFPPDFTMRQPSASTVISPAAQMNGNGSNSAPFFVE